MKITYNRINYALLIVALFLAILFSGLLLHNQSYTEYLLVLDSWRFLNKLQSQSALIEYFFHNVHMFALPSFILYLDILFSDGNLQLQHHIVSVSTLAVFLSISYISLKHRDQFNGSWSAAISLPLFILAMWLSPSNARAYTYPLLDVISSISLLCIILMALVYPRIVETSTLGNHKFTFYLSLILISCIGLFTLEIYILLLIILACDSLIRKVFHLSTLLWLIVAIGAAFYLISQKYLNAVPLVSHDFHFMASLYNFMIFLSSHIYFLISELGWGKQAEIAISILFSVSSIAYLVGVSGHLIQQLRRIESWLLLPLLLIAFSLSSLAAATWLRFSDVEINSAIARYTPYSVMFAIGIVMISSWLLANTNNRLVKSTSILVFSLYFVATSLDAWAMYTKSHNMGSIFIDLRKEMSVYAQSPGHERRLGPVEPDGGVQYRSRLHSFLENKGISVFSSQPYSYLNTKINDLQRIKKIGCKIINYEYINRRKERYIEAQFELAKPQNKGVFLVVDGNNIIVDFSFSSIHTPFSRYASGIFRSNDNRSSSVFYLRNPNDSILDQEYISCGSLISSPTAHILTL